MTDAATGTTRVLHGAMAGRPTRYTLNTKLGESTHAEIHRGYRDDGTPVLVKLSRSERPSALELLRLRHEHELLASLDLPEVVKALALERHGHRLALVMEDAGDTSVEKLIRSGYLDLRRSLQLAVAMAGVLAAVHQKQVIHRDVKPHHFIVRGAEGRDLVLVDFGSATRLSQRVQVSPLTELEGTLAYIAPEQTGRMNRVVDFRADLYSLGVTLYELFTGSLPFEATDPLELVHSHIARTPRSPSALRADLPKVLCDLISKLLSKSAEQRYQSAAGVQHDLQRCLEQLTRHDAVEVFELAERDSSGVLSIPQKLYGRERELAELLESFERVKQGANELVLLSGPAGVGKSALVDELHQRLLGCSYSGAGKFDYLARSVPYAPIAHACRALVRALLAESPAVLAKQRQSILEAVGPNGQLLVDLVPELELVIGAQPSVPALGPSESQHRFELVFLNFLRVFATREHPLVLFMDDVQWADPGSLRLLQGVLTAAGPGHVLLIAAYRENELTAAHALSLSVQELRRAGTAIRELALEPLQLSHVVELLRETLLCAPRAADELGAVLFEKTGGNPFFVAQFLTALHRDGLLHFDRQAWAWRWDLARVRGRLATDNVVEFMLSELERLPPATRDVLRLAACVGHRFDVQTLAVVSRCAAHEVADHLWEALRQGFIVPLDANCRYAGALEPDAATSPDDAPNAVYRFLHDRVQQAAYSLVGEGSQADIHLRIGRLLLKRSSGAPRERDLFEIADHLNRGASLLADASERREVARLNLAAGRRARAAAAPEAAVHYLNAALGLLGDTGWATEYDVALSCHLIGAECEYLTGNVDRAFSLLEAVEQNARSAQERARSRNLEVLLLTNTGRLGEACAKIVEALRLLRVDLPPLSDKGALGAAIGEEFGGYRADLATRTVESLAELPETTDPDDVLLLQTLANGIPAAFMALPELHVLLVLKGVRLLCRATTPLAGFFFEQYAIVHLVMTSDREMAFRFGQLGVDLAARPGSSALAGQVHFLFGSFISHWRAHISRTLELLRSGLRLSLEVGDQIYAAYCAALTLHYRFYAGENLDEVEEGVQSARALAQKTGDVVSDAFCRICQQAVRALKGQTAEPGSLQSADFDEAAFAASPLAPPVAMYQATKTIVQYFAGRHRDALATADACNLLPGFFYHGERAFYRALSLAELTRTAPGEERADLVERLRADADVLAAWAQSAPANHAHRSALVQAELARIEGRTADALELYDRAIALAEEHGFIQAEALGNELSARFHVDQRRNKVAAPYLVDALYAYERWGATSKVDELKSKYPQLLRTAEVTRGLTPMRADMTVPTPHRGSEVTTTVQLGRSLDLVTAIRATEAIATELVADRLLERLMRTLVENAGAQRGCLIVDHDGVLVIEASMTIEPDVIHLGSEELCDNSKVPETLVRYVARTGELTLLADAARDPRFAADPYFSGAQPQSVLCVPMLQRGKVAGVLYLQNSVAADGFSAARAGLLQFLATQAAVALENARLYGRLNAASDELRGANENLEKLVAERTAELRRALAELWSEMDLARKIQTVLLPERSRSTHYDMAAVMLPAESVGGDYYDVVETGGKSWVLVGDVSGHGVTAGLIMMMVQTAARTILLTAPEGEQLSPAMVLSRANRAVRETLSRIGPDQYMTIVALELGPGVVRYAGLHQDILIHRASSDTIEFVETQGMWVGIVDDITPLLQDQSVTLEVGDTLLLYTDGITESTSQGKMLETQGLAERFHALAARGLEPAAIVKAIVGPLTGQVLRDDVTVMAIRYRPEAASVAAE